MLAELAGFLSTLPDEISVKDAIQSSNLPAEHGSICAPRKENHIRRQGTELSLLCTEHLELFLSPIQVRQPTSEGTSQ